MHVLVADDFEILYMNQYEKKKSIQIKNIWYYNFYIHIIN